MQYNCSLHCENYRLESTLPRSPFLAKPFDSTLKQIIDRYCGDWTGFVCEQAGLPAGTRAEPLDADLSTVSPQSDKLFRVEPPAGGLIHLELQASWSGEQPGQLHLYNTLAEYRYGAPVRSLLLLLRPEAEATAATGLLTRRDERGEYLRFRYGVIRLWELPSEPLLAGPPGLLPLSLLTDDAKPRLPELIRRVDERLQAAKLPVAGHAEILTACQILLGLRYTKAVIQTLYRGLRTMRESSTYMAILEEGIEEGLSKGRIEGIETGEILGLREAIEDIGTSQFGSPSETTLALLAAIADRTRLRRLMRHLRTAATWDDLLAVQ